MVCRLWWWAVGGLDDGEGEFLELGEQRAELFGVVEQRLPGGELLGGEPAGGGLPADLAGPFGVGAVPGGRAGVAAAAGLAAFVGAHDQGAGQGRAGCRGELGGDLVQGLLLPGGWVHATHRLRSMALTAVHSIFLWNRSLAGRRYGRAGPRGGRLYRALGATVGLPGRRRVRP